jgi:excinuclease ABC subunit C
MALAISSGGKHDFSSLPKGPGCYLYKDKDGTVIYVGKAKDLRSRVRSYFSGEQSVKTQHLVSRIRTIEWIVVDHEIEALLLENTLIKRHYPKYNIDLKENRRYAYITITGERFPRILTTRKVMKGGTTFGPYTDGFQRVQLIKTAVSIFKVRTCTILPKRACLNFHIGICTAPCIGNVDEAKYARQVEGAKAFLRGDMDGTITTLKEEMKAAAGRLHFEKALEIRQQVEAIQGIVEKQKVALVKGYDQDVIAMVQHNDQAIFEILPIAKGVMRGKSEYKVEYSDGVFEEFLKRYYASRKIPGEILVNSAWTLSSAETAVLEAYFSKLRGGKVEIIRPERGEKAGLVRLAEKNALLDLEENKALVDLKEALNLPDYPQIIECFDISNLGDEHIVAGMTRFVDGRPDLQGYRRFLIRSTGKQDDVQSVREAVLRRYRRVQVEKGEIPDLIVIDGGWGQLGAALSSLKSLGLKVPTIALAKEDEEIHTPQEEQPLRLDKLSRMMLLLREIRDNTHRYVLAYNKKRREMKLRGEFKKAK